MLISPRTSRNSGVVDVTVQPNRPGNLLLKVRSLNGAIGEMNVNVPMPSIKKLIFRDLPSKVYVGTSTLISVKIIVLFQIREVIGQTHVLFESKRVIILFSSCLFWTLNNVRERIYVIKVLKGSEHAA